MVTVWGVADTSRRGVRITTRSVQVLAPKSPSEQSAHGALAKRASGESANLWGSRTEGNFGGGANGQDSDGP